MHISNAFVKQFNPLLHSVVQEQHWTKISILKYDEIMEIISHKETTSI